MAFVDRYIGSLHASNLMDDNHHSATEALAASALADVSIDGIGALLCRVKYADGAMSKLFESGSTNLAQLLRIWAAVVTKKGIDRKWVKIRIDTDTKIAHDLYKRVAAQSLAYWLSGGVIDCGGYERQIVLDMVSELESAVQSHNGRASIRLKQLRTIN